MPDTLSVKLPGAGFSNGEENKLRLHGAVFAKLVRRGTVAGGRSYA
jgi:hypothetical protein